MDPYTHKSRIQYLHKRLHVRNTHKSWTHVHTKQGSCTRIYAPKKYSMRAQIMGPCVCTQSQKHTPRTHPSYLMDPYCKPKKHGPIHTKKTGSRLVFTRANVRHVGSVEVSFGERFHNVHTNHEPMYTPKNTHAHSYTRKKIQTRTVTHTRIMDSKARHP